MTLQLTDTLDNLIIRVRRWLNEPTESKSWWTNDFLQEVINSNYRLRCSELHMAAEGYFVSIVIRDLVDAQFRYAWPPNFQRLNKLELVRSDGRRVPVQRYERHEAVVGTSNQSTVGDSYNPTYRPTGSGFDLEPGPNGTVTNGLRLEYIGLPQELSLGSDSFHPDFPSLYTELIVIDSAISAMNVESIVDGGQGLLRTLELERRRWEERWERYVEGRLVSRQSVDPFPGPYRDA